MAITTVSTARFRSVLKTFSETDLGDLETSYAAYEVALAADDTKTWTVTPIGFFWDGTNFILAVMSQYPEKNVDPIAQVPELP